MMYRLPAREGEWINRERTLGFCFEGQRHEGYEGETLTSAPRIAGYCAPPGLSNAGAIE